jgi:hypothetical protein
MKAKFCVLLMILASACGLRSPVSHRVAIDIERDGEHARVTATTELSRSTSDAMEQRIAVMRDAILSGHDEWSNRFGSLTLESERVILDKERGELRRAEHSGVMKRDDLQRFFGDTPVLTKFTRGDVWAELAIYAGSSARATRPQREEVQRTLDEWSRNAARYVNSMGRLYEFIDRHPQRAEAAFTLLFAEENMAHSKDEEEDALVNGARDAMDALSKQFDTARKSAWSIDEEFDLVYNPFPAEIVVHTPHPITTFDRFAKKGDDTVYIRRAGLLDAIRALEGKWLAPDPLAMMMRADEDHAEMPTNRELAAMPRTTTHMTAKEIEDAVVEALTPGTVYRVRWSE